VRLTTPPAGTGAAATTTTADTDIEAPRVACGTVKAARDALDGEAARRRRHVRGPECGFADPPGRRWDASAALKALAPEITKAAGETTDVTLKDKLTKFASAIDGAVGHRGGGRRPGEAGSRC
jgi:hypothetical protein